MIVDSLNKFAEGTATGNTGTRVIGDVIDLGAPNRDLGAGEPIYLNVVVDTAITAGAGGTIQFALTSAADAALTSSPVNHLITGTLDAAAGVAIGTVLFNVALPSALYGRFLGVREIVAVANTTAGKIDAFLSRNQNAYRSYAGAK